MNEFSSTELRLPTKMCYFMLSTRFCRILIVKNVESITIMMYRLVVHVIVALPEIFSTSLSSNYIKKKLVCHGSLERHDIHMLCIHDVRPIQHHGMQKNLSFFR